MKITIVVILNPALHFFLTSHVKLLVVNRPRLLNHRYLNAIKKKERYRTNFSSSYCFLLLRYQTTTLSFGGAQIKLTHQSERNESYRLEIFFRFHSGKRQTDEGLVLNRSIRRFKRLRLISKFFYKRFNLWFSGRFETSVARWVPNYAVDIRQLRTLRTIHAYARHDRGLNTGGSSCPDPPLVLCASEQRRRVAWHPTNTRENPNSRSPSISMISPIFVPSLSPAPNDLPYAPYASPQIVSVYRILKELFFENYLRTPGSDCQFSLKYYFSACFGTEQIFWTE